MSDAEEWENIGGWYDRLTHWRYGHGIVPANYCAGSHEFSVDVRFALREIAALRARAERADQAEQSIVAPTGVAKWRRRSPMHDDGGPAFPLAILPESDAVYSGMSYRDAAALAALQGWVAHFLLPISDATKKEVAEHCYALADAMLAARRKEPGA